MTANIISPVELISKALNEWAFGLTPMEVTDEFAEKVILTLAENGFSVVKTPELSSERVRAAVERSKNSLGDSVTIEV